MGAYNDYRIFMRSLDRNMKTYVPTLLDTLLALERAALGRWGRGDPSGFLEICAPDVTYFDPFLTQRIEGLPALTAYYESLRGRIKVDRDEISSPWVQAMGDVAVLSFNYQAVSGDDGMFWHCTEVYCQREGAWRILHTHWSLLAKGA